MIRFLICLSEYCGNLTNMNTYKMASDNISLVDNVKAFQADVADLTLLDPDTPTYQKAAQHSLKSDWDILNEIQKTYPTTMQLDHRNNGQR
jgi:hypothetical protein